jgi:hypothetical protein
MGPPGPLGPIQGPAPISPSLLGHSNTPQTGLLTDPVISVLCGHPGLRRVPRGQGACGRAVIQQWQALWAGRPHMGTHLQRWGSHDTQHFCSRL